MFMETTLDLAALLEKPDLDAESYRALKEAAFATTESLNRFGEIVAGMRRAAESGGGEGPSAALKTGLCTLLVGDSAKAAEYLQKARPGALRDYHLGMALRDLRKYEAAAAQFESAAKAGWDRTECEAQRAECLILSGETDAAARLIDGIAGEGSSRAAWHYAKGRLLQEQGRLEEAIESYEAALAIDVDYAQAMFHLAYLFDLHGSDDRARELYYRCSELPYVYSHALMNLAVILEDRAEYQKAASCLRRVLAVNPSNQRAQLYYKDVLAAGDMFIDEVQIKIQEKRDAVLDIPITDFELSVRSRNCLKKMNINSLGDLLRITEAELLSYKNFGETSLREIKAMLAQKGLTLGQNADRKKDPALAKPAADLSMFPDTNPEVLSRPVAALELSVRSRKCLQRLGINTVGELASRSEQELLESRNFGQTSLKELKNRLAELGLSLRDSPKDVALGEPDMPPAEA